jgi:hypothetical protein
VAISEAARHDLYTGLSGLLGPERTETLMGALPLHDLDEVATKSDVMVLAADIRALRSELLAVIATEVESVRRSTYTSMVTLLIAIIAAMVGVRLLP